MTARLSAAKSFGPLLLGLMALLLAACGGAAAPEPTPTPTATPLPPTATATPVLPTATATPWPTPDVFVPAATPESGGETVCPDPYPDGAPYQPEPGDPILLRPTGWPSALARYQPQPFVADPALEQVVRQSIGEDEGHLAVMVKNLADGRGVTLAADREFYAASLYKTWVMLEAYHQREGGFLDFGEQYVVSDYYGQRYRLNPGELEACSRVTVDYALAEMVQASDNVAAGLMLDRVGAGNVNRTLRSVGLAVSGFPGGGRLPTTAADMALLLEAIARRQVVSEAASEEMLALLSACRFHDRLPALLPEDVRVAHKTGSWRNATHDAGIVFSPRATYIIVVLTDFDFEDDGATPIARLSRAVYDYYNPN